MAKTQTRNDVASKPLLSGIAALTNPDYHALNRRGERLLHAVLCAYAKHHFDQSEIGWEQLDDILCDAICEEIGDEAFCAWMKTISDNTAVTGDAGGGVQ